MKYNYTAYINDENERIKEIAKDILSEYPNLGDTAIQAARMEEPFGRAHEDYEMFSQQENMIKRLINIIIVTDGKPEFLNEHNKAIADIKEAFDSWKHGFTYSNPEEQTVYILMQRLFEHLKDEKKPISSVQEIKQEEREKREAESKRRQYIHDHTMEYNYTAYISDENERTKAITNDILREYPNLGEVAMQAAQMEKPFGRMHEDYDMFSRQENVINRLINIIIVTEGKPEFLNEYNKAIADIKTAFDSWKRGFTYAFPEKQPVYILMQQLFKHLNDPSQPICSVQDIENQMHSNMHH